MEILLFTILVTVCLKIMYGVTKDPWSYPYHLTKVSFETLCSAQNATAFQKAVQFVLKQDKRFPSLHTKLNLGHTYDSMCVEILHRMKAMREVTTQV